MKTFLLYFFAIFVSLWYISHMFVSAMRYSKGKTTPGDALARVIEILAMAALWAYIICMN